MSKIIAKNISKNLRGKCSQKPLGHAKQSATDAFKTAIKRAIEEKRKQLVIWFVIKFLTKLQKFQKLYNKIIQLQLSMLQMSMIKKYLKKDIYLLKKGNKLLMI